MSARAPHPTWAASILGAGLFGAALFTAAGAQAAEPVIVVVVPDNSQSSTTDRAAATIAAHLRPLGARALVVHEKGPADSTKAIAGRARDLSAGHSARGVLWVGASATELSLFLFSPDDNKLFTRRVPAEKGRTAVAVESLAVIAGAAAGELLEGKPPTMVPVEVEAAKEAPPPPAAVPVAALVEAPKPLPPAPPPPPPRFVVVPDFAAPGADHVTPVGEGSKLALGAGYEGSVGFGKATWQSAIAATVGFRPIPAFTIALGYQVVFPDDDSQTVTETRHHPGFLSAGYRFLFGPRWDLELSGRATVDVVTQEHRHFEGEGSDTDLSVRVRVGPTAELGFRVLPPLRVGLLVGMEVLMNPADETKMVPGGMSTLFGTGDLKRPVTVAPSAADHFGFLGGLGLQLDLDLSGGRPRSGVARR